jgi:hypothetical protein
MKTSRYYLLPAAVSALLMSAAPGMAQNTTASTGTEDTSRSSQEQTVQMSQVPRAAREAAQKALGTKPTDAKVIVGTSPQEYQLMAKSSSGREAKVRVLADGTLMKNGKPEKEAQASPPTTR